MERDRRGNGRKSGRGFPPVTDAKISLEEEDAVTSLLTSRHADRWVPPGSLWEEKKEGRAGLACWASAGLSWDAHAWKKREGEMG